MLRKMFGLAAPDVPMAQDLDLDQALERATQARQAADLELRDARGAIARVQAVVDAVEPAERAAAEAAAAVESAAAEWAASGAASPFDDKGLVDGQREAEVALAVARRLAAGVAKGLPALSDREEAARLAVDRAREAELQIAVRLVIDEEAGPLLAKLERAREEYLALHAQLGAWRLLIWPKWGPTNEFSRFRDAAFFERLVAADIRCLEFNGLKSEDGPQARALIAKIKARLGD